MKPYEQTEAPGLLVIDNKIIPPLSRYDISLLKEAYDIIRDMWGQVSPEERRELQEHTDRIFNSICRAVSPQEEFGGLVGRVQQDHV